jgi:hypothetical protein
MFPDASHWSMRPRTKSAISTLLGATYAPFAASAISSANLIWAHVSGYAPSCLPPKWRARRDVFEVARNLQNGNRFQSRRYAPTRPDRNGKWVWWQPSISTEITGGVLGTAAGFMAGGPVGAVIGGAGGFLLGAVTALPNSSIDKGGSYTSPGKCFHRAAAVVRPLGVATA